MSNTQTQREVLMDLYTVRGMLSDPKRWTKGASARNKYRHRVSPTSPSAVKWCLEGAVNRSSAGAPSVASRRAFWVRRYLIEATPVRPWLCGIAWFNDDPETTHADVLALIDRAIDLALAAARMEGPS